MSFEYLLLTGSFIILFCINLKYIFFILRRFIAIEFYLSLHKF